MALSERQTPKMRVRFRVKQRAYVGQKNVVVVDDDVGVYELPADSIYCCCCCCCLADFCFHFSSSKGTTKINKCQRGHADKVATKRFQTANYKAMPRTCPRNSVLSGMQTEAIKQLAGNKGDNTTN